VVVTGDFQEMINSTCDSKAGTEFTCD